MKIMEKGLFKAFVFCVCSEISERFKRLHRLFCFGRLDRGVSPLLSLQTGFMAGSKLKKRYAKMLLVLASTMRFCPAGLAPTGNESDRERSSSNSRNQCLLGSGIEEKSG